MPQLDERELATMLWALRQLQLLQEVEGRQGQEMAMRESGLFVRGDNTDMPLPSPEYIDNLCERLNAGIPALGVGPRDATLQLLVLVNYQTNGTSLQVLRDNLKAIADHAFADGWITGDTEAEVTDMEASVTNVYAKEDVVDREQPRAGQ